MSDGERVRRLERVLRWADAFHRQLERVRAIDVPSLGYAKRFPEEFIRRDGVAEVDVTLMTLVANRVAVAVVEAGIPKSIRGALNHERLRLLRNAWEHPAGEPRENYWSRYGVEACCFSFGSPPVNIGGVNFDELELSVRASEEHALQTWRELPHDFGPDDGGERAYGRTWWLLVDSLEQKEAEAVAIRLQKSIAQNGLNLM